MAGTFPNPISPSLSQIAGLSSISAGASTSTPIYQSTMSLSDLAILYSDSNELATLPSPSTQIAQRMFHPFLKTTPYSWESEVEYHSTGECRPRVRRKPCRSKRRYESELRFDPEWWSNKSFPQFPKLPLELRLKIWGLLVPNAARLVLVQFRKTDEKPLHLTYLSLRPLNVCQEERQELLRCFRIEVQGHESVQISEFTTTDISVFDVTRDIACFESSTQLTQFCGRSRFGQSLPFGLSDIQHITIGEVVIRMTRSGVVGSSTSDLGGLRRILGRIQVFPALKSLTIVRLCHPNKIRKTPGQKRHVAPHRLLGKEEGSIIIDHLNGLLWSRNRKDPRSAPSVKILSHGKKLDINPTTMREPAELVELDQFIEVDD